MRKLALFRMEMAVITGLVGTLIGVTRGQSLDTLVGQWLGSGLLFLVFLVLWMGSR